MSFIKACSIKLRLFVLAGALLAGGGLLLAGPIDPQPEEVSFQPVDGLMCPLPGAAPGSGSDVRDMPYSRMRLEAQQGGAIARTAAQSQQVDRAPLRYI